MNVMLKLTALFLLENVRNVLFLINSRKYSLNTSNKKLWLDQPALWLKSQRASWESRICLVICRRVLSVTCGHFVKPPKDVPLQVGQTSTFARARGVFYRRLRTFLDVGHLASLLEHQKLKWVEFGANCRRRKNHHLPHRQVTQCGKLGKQSKRRGWRSWRLHRTLFLRPAFLQVASRLQTFWNWA